MEPEPFINIPMPMRSVRQATSARRKNWRIEPVLRAKREQGEMSSRFEIRKFFEDLLLSESLAAGYYLSSTIAVNHTADNATPTKPCSTANGDSRTSSGQSNRPNLKAPSLSIRQRPA